MPVLHLSYFCIFGRQGKEKFAFAYDDLDRLTQQYYPQSADNDENDFNVTVGYQDAIGNISGINRNGLIDVDPITGELTFGLIEYSGVK